LQFRFGVKLAGMGRLTEPAARRMTMRQIMPIECWPPDRWDIQPPKASFHANGMRRTGAATFMLGS
jgi:hypothetical protein